MAEAFSRPQPQYVRASQIRRRYGMSKSTFYRLTRHPDPLIRFPRPRLILGTTPLWLEADVAAYEHSHRKAVEGA